MSEYDDHKSHQTLNIHQSKQLRNPASPADGTQDRTVSSTRSPSSSRSLLASGALLRDASRLILLLVCRIADISRDEDADDDNVACIRLAALSSNVCLTDGFGWAHTQQELHQATSQIDRRGNQVLRCSKHGLDRMEEGIED